MAEARGPLLGGTAGAEPLAGKRPGTRAAAARLGVLVLLVILVALGLRSPVGAPTWGTTSKALDAFVAGGLDVLAAVLLAVLLVHARRAPATDAVVARARTALRYTLAGAVVVLSAALAGLVVDLHVHPGQAAPGTRSTAPLGPPKLAKVKPSHASAWHLPISQFFDGLLAALVVVAIVFLALRLKSYARLPAAPQRQPPAEDYGTTLQEAVSGGQRALLRLEDARAAIIACYVAMEESLARAGTARLSADTPDELLAKASGLFLVSAGAARRLTLLFYEARFSSHPMGDNRRRQAEDALSELAADLGRAAAPPAPSAP